MEQIERLKQEQGLIEQEVKLCMKDNEYATSGNYRISWSSVQSTRLDTKRMKEEQPDKPWPRSRIYDFSSDIYRNYAVQSVSRRFQVRAA